MNKKQKINKILESKEFINELKKLDEKQRELVENSAKELLGDMFDALSGAITNLQRRKSRVKPINEPTLDDSNVIKEKE